LVKGKKLVVKRALSLQVNIRDLEEQWYIFHMKCHIHNKKISIIINSEDCTNMTSTDLVDKFNSLTSKHPIPYKLQWLNDFGEVKVLQ
jgi:hypothetical protein